MASRALRRVGQVAAGFAVLVVALVAFALARAESKLQFPDTPAPAVQVSQDPEVIERGRYLVHGPAHCAECHSGSDRDHPEQVLTEPLHGGLEFDMGPLAVTWSANLTPDKETGIGRWTDQQVARAIRTGVLPDGRLSFFMGLSAARLSDDDLSAVVSYLRSLPPVKNEVPRGVWRPLGKVLLQYVFPPLKPRLVEGPPGVPPSDEPSAERGHYLVEHAAFCVDCHTQFDMATFALKGPRLGGSQPDPSHGSDTDMEFVAPNLTSHPTGMTGKLDEEQFVARLRGGRVYKSSIMPWENFTTLTEADARSIYRYLREVPPVDNDVGPTYRKVGWKPGS